MNLDAIPPNVWLSLFWGGAGYLCYRYVWKHKHPEKPVWTAWFEFIGVLSLAVGGGLVVVLGAALALGMEGHEQLAGRLLAPMVVIGILSPAWAYAKKVIGRI